MHVSIEENGFLNVFSNIQEDACQPRQTAARRQDLKYTSAFFQHLRSVGKRGKENSRWQLVHGETSGAAQKIRSKIRKEREK